MWTEERSQGMESDKIAALCVPYTRGRGVDIGCGMRTVWPHAIGVDNGHHFGAQTAATVFGDGSDLSIFADGSLDFVFSSHTLEHFPEEKVPAILAEWTRVLKPEGYLVLYVPSANLYPKVGEPGANPDHKWNIYPGDIAARLKSATACGWTQVEDEERGTPEDNEYSLYEVYRKRTDGQFVHAPFVRHPEGKQRCLVIRYGAIGDQIIASSILPEIRKQGFHITYQAMPSAQQVLLHDPHVDEWWIQDRDQVPNPQLGAYWESLRLSGRFDRIINLCESIEGQLLALPGRLNGFYPPEVRRRIMNKNYLEHTHDIADVPFSFHPKFYATDAEKQNAREARAGIDAPIVVWALNGSSPHKVYPFSQVVATWLLLNTPVHLFFLTDPDEGMLLQNAIMEELKKQPEADLSRVHCMGGVWGIREALTFACQEADCVVGPETGILNAVGMEKVKKVIYLSHSSAQNLTKYWKHATVLKPEPKKVPCYPCHMLHTGWANCHQVAETGAALCASSIAPELIFKSIGEALGARVIAPKRKVA